MFVEITRKSFIFFVAVLLLLFSSTLATKYGFIELAFAAPNYQINYQGKLTDNTGATVADGDYDMEFSLYTAASGTAAVWTETLDGADQVPVANGLFSVMLGSTSALTGVNFDQTLYLGVTIGADNEMQPRKILGAVPAAFFAATAEEANTVGGVASTSFLRSDQADTATGLLTFANGFVSAASSTIFGLSSTNATSTNLYVNSGVTFAGITSGPLVANSTGVVSASSTIQDSYLSDDLTIGAGSTFGNDLITPNSVLSNGQTDEYCLTYEASGTTWAWQDCASTIAADSLDFDDFTDSMTLDATTTIAMAHALNFDSGTLFINAQNNRMGIGTTTPSRHLSVIGAASAQLQLANSTGGGANLVMHNTDSGFSGTDGLYLGMAADENVYLWNYENSLLQFATNNTARMTIAAAGNVGIGTTSPYAKLSVAGQVVGQYFTATSTATNTLPTLSVTGGFYDGSGTAGTDGFVLQTTGTGVEWVATTSLGFASAGSAHDAVTLAGTPNYLTLSGQEITLNALDLADDLNAFSSANLSGKLSDETGSGVAVFGTNPLLAGFRSNASSTIGGGAQATGLTISGGATTTANAYIAGRLGVGTQPHSTYAIDTQGFINTSQYGGFKMNGNTVLYATTTTSSLSLGAVTAAAWMRATSSPVRYALAIGEGALAATPTNGAAIKNTAIGYYALNALTTGANNVALGANTLQKTTIGGNNLGIGTFSLFNNTTGSNNICIGTSCSQNLTTASGNVGMGYTSLFYNTTGANNTAIGHLSSYRNQSATNTVAIGAYAGYGAGGNFNSQGSVAVGYYSGYNFTTGSNYNTLLGYQSGYDITAGLNNIIIGADTSTGNGVTSGSNNIIIGQDVRSGLTQTASNQLNIGNLIFSAGLGSGTTVGTGNLGIGTSTPGTLFSVQGVANFHTATSTFRSTGGIDLTDGCYAIDGVCIGGGGAITKSDITNSGTLSFDWDDSEVSDVLTVTGGTLGSNTLASGATWSTAGTITIGDGGDRIDISSDTWDVTNGVITNVTSINGLTITANTGALSAGSITSGFGAIDIGSDLLTAGSLRVSSNDAGALGASGTAWSDLFLASGGVINWNAGDVTMTHAANTLTFAGASTAYVFSDGNVAIGTTTSDNRLTVFETVAEAQLRLAYDATRYANFQIDSVGDLLLNASGNDILIQSDNLWVCESGTCPSITASSTAGYAIVENGIYFGNGFKIDQIAGTTTQLGMYNASGTVIVIFEQ